MVRKILIPLVIFIFSSNLCAASTKEAEEKTFERSKILRRAAKLDEIFRKGLSREGYGTYENAIYAYNAVLALVDRMLNSRNIDKAAIREIMPYYIAAAYRKGIVTHRYIEGSVITLYRQLQLYEDADKWIQQVLTTISNISMDRDVVLPSSQFGMLYFAKSYNRAGWAFAMLNGSSWKRYIIYPPSQTFGMIDKCAADLKRMMGFYGFDYAEKAKNNYNSTIKTYVNSLPWQSSEHTTLSLCYASWDKDAIIKLLSGQIEFNAKKALDLYNSPKITSAIEKGKSAYSFEDFTKPESKEFISVISKFLAEMDVKQ